MCHFLADRHRQDSPSQIRVRSIKHTVKINLGKPRLILMVRKAGIEPGRVLVKGF